MGQNLWREANGRNVLEDRELLPFAQSECSLEFLFGVVYGPFCWLVLHLSTASSNGGKWGLQVPNSERASQH